MIPVDPWHTALADWRITIVTRIEAALEGCADHRIGADTLTH